MYSVNQSNRREFLGTAFGSIAGCIGLYTPGTKCFAESDIPLNPSERSVSEEAIELIKHFEGPVRLKAYLCPGNKWTIGIGHTKDVHKGYQLQSIDEAEALLIEDLNTHRLVIANHCQNVGLTQNQFDALVSANFNVNMIGAGLGFSKFVLTEIPRLNNLDSLQDYRGECHGLIRYMCKYHYANKKPLDGLLRRRLSEGLLFAGYKNPIVTHQEYLMAKKIAAENFIQTKGSAPKGLKDLIPVIVQYVTSQRAVDTDHTNPSLPAANQE